MSDINAALTRFRTLQPAYTLYGDYYAGRHRLAYMSAKFASAFGTLFRAYAKNFCARVVDAQVDRLRVVGFGVVGEDRAARAVRRGRQRRQEVAANDAGDAAWAWWETSRLAQRANEVHTEALISGDAYLQVWPDAEGTPQFYMNDARQMTVFYDPELPGTIQWAAKCWVQADGRVRLTLYHPDRVEKYVTERAVGLTTATTVETLTTAGVVPGTTFTPTTELGEGLFIPYEQEGEPWPLFHDYGHPTIFHFANRARLGGFGTSELHAVIPVQDELNKAVLDMLVAMEIVALPQRYAVGWEPDIDETTGQARQRFSPEAGALWYFGGDGTNTPQVGQFPAADLTHFLQVQDTAKADIARLSATPLHYLMLQSGEFPSGESMKTAEAPFVAKLEQVQTVFGPVWADVLALALRIGQNPQEVRLVTDWFDPEPRSEKAHIETLAVKKTDLEVPLAQIWREADYTEVEITDMLAEVTDREQAVSAARLAAIRAEQTAALGLPLTPAQQLQMEDRTE